jgi:hypothetical protein
MCPPITLQNSKRFFSPSEWKSPWSSIRWPDLNESHCYTKGPMTLRPTLDGGPGSKFLGTNLDTLEANLSPWVEPCLHLGSPNHELFILVQTNLFSSKMVPCRFRLNLSLFGLGPWSEGCGSNLWLLANRIALFHWTLDLGPSSKVTLD